MRARDSSPGAARRGLARRFAVFVGAVLADAPAAAAEFGASWTADFATVLDGGLREGERAPGLLELVFDHAWPVRQRELALHLSAQHVYGGGFSEHWVGDLQTVSNVDADDGTRVLQAWVEVPLTDALALKVGRYDFNSEFDALEAGALFLNSAQGIGTEIAQTGAVGPSIFPSTALGLRLQYDAGADGSWRVVALDVEADPDGEYSDAPFTGGTMLALEYEHATATTTWKGGAWGFARTRATLEDQDREPEYGVYGSVEHRLGDRWSVYARLGLANDDVSRIGRYFGAGLVRHEGLLPGRDDAFGFALAHARNGDPYREALRADGVATDAAETALELTWRVPFGEHLALQPDLQYVIDPGTDPSLDDALVFILRVELAL